VLAPSFGVGAEFDAIAAIVDRLGPRATGIGDDGAIIQVPRGDRVVASTDATVEGRHFRRDWLEPREIGYRATVAALSDLAAMAARPIGILTALGVPNHWIRELPEIADGIFDALAVAGTCALGGNVSGAGELSLTTTVIGHAFRPVCRSGAAAGDAIYVTGELGGPHCALAAWRRGVWPEPVHRDRFARPVPRLAEARWLAERGVSAAIDVSDGLVADLRHLLEASRVSAEIELSRIPVVEGASPIDGAIGGEEYEILVTGPADLSVGEFEATFDVRLTAIGRISSGSPDVLIRSNGSRVAVPSGYDHLSP